MLLIAHHLSRKTVAAFAPDVFEPAADKNTRRVKDD
jgi:hypothetical protein